MWFVYVDYRLDTNLPFYVGMGNKNRINNMKRNLYHTNVKNHCGIKREIILTTFDRNFAIEQEIRLINELKTRDILGGANFTDGGEGATRIKTQHERNKQREIMKQAWKNNHDKMMHAVFNSDVQLRRTASVQRTSRTPQARKKQSEIAFRVSNNPENRKRRSQAQILKNKKIENRLVKSKTIQQIDIKTNKVLNEFYSANEAQRQTGFGQGNISRTARNQRGSAYGYFWRYI